MMSPLIISIISWCKSAGYLLKYCICVKYGYSFLSVDCNWWQAISFLNCVFAMGTWVTRLLFRELCQWQEGKLFQSFSIAPVDNKRWKESSRLLHLMILILRKCVSWPLWFGYYQVKFSGRKQVNLSEKERWAFITSQEEDQMKLSERERAFAVSCLQEQLRNTLNSYL